MKLGAGLGLVLIAIAEMVGAQERHRLHDLERLGS